MASKVRFSVEKFQKNKKNIVTPFVIVLGITFVAGVGAAVMGGMTGCMTEGTSGTPETSGDNDIIVNNAKGTKSESDKISFSKADNYDVDVTAKYIKDTCEKFNKNISDVEAKDVAKLVKELSIFATHAKADKNGGATNDILEKNKSIIVDANKIDKELTSGGSAEVKRQSREDNLGELLYDLSTDYKVCKTVRLTGATNGYVGDTINMGVTFKPNNADVEFEYKSSDNKLATVTQDGKVKLLAQGDVRIKITDKKTGVSDSRSIKIAIKNNSSIVEESSKESGQTSTPSSQTSKPSSQTSTPSSQTSKPSSQTSTPSSQTSTPSSQTSKPSSQTSTQTSQTSKPSTQTSKPSTQTSTPSTQTSTPQTQTTPQQQTIQLICQRDVVAVNVEDTASTCFELIIDGFGVTITSYPVSYSSSNTSVATVDSGGIVRGISEGTATITASYKGASASCTVTVKEVKVDLTDPNAPAPSYYYDEFGNKYSSNWNTEEHEKWAVYSNRVLKFYGVPEIVPIINEYRAKEGIPPLHWDTHEEVVAVLGDNGAVNNEEYLILNPYAGGQPHGSLDGGSVAMCIAIDDRYDPKGYIERLMDSYPHRKKLMSVSSIYACVGGPGNGWALCIV